MSLARSASANPSPSYERHQTEHTLLYQLVEQHYPIFKASLQDQGQSLPHYIQQQFDDFLKYSRLEYGFLWLRCEDCHHERLVAFSCKRRGFCPGCGARRMAESAALSVDAIFPEAPIRHWVLRFPFQLYFLLARYPTSMGEVLSIVYRALSTPPYQTSRLHQGDSAHRPGDPDPMLWLGTESQSPLSPAFSR